MEELQDLEGRLYAEIHYDSGCVDKDNSAFNNVVSSSTDKPSSEYEPNKRLSAVASGLTKKLSKRYWSDSTNTSFVSNDRQSKGCNPNQSNTLNNKHKNKSLEKSKSEAVVSVPMSIPTTSTDNRPKQFTPYVSLLSSGESFVSDTQPISKVIDSSQSKSVTAVASLKATNKIIKNQLKNIETPHAKQKETDRNKTPEKGSKKRLNPFSQLQLQHQNRREKYDVKKEKAKKAREKLKNKKIEGAHSSVVVNLDDDENVNASDNDDDDVIILPTQAPPLICVDSSDEENNAKEISIAKSISNNDYEFTEPTTIDSRRSRTTRCGSPSSSIQSTDDFIAPNDASRQGFGFDNFATVTDEDLYEVCETVENALRKTNKSSTNTSNNVIDSEIFTPPKRMNIEKAKSTPTKKSYEVGANSFAAVDVYESESSDMPESIYAIGTKTNKRKEISNSDSSSVESVAITKSKRLRKRKSSSCTKESEKSDDSSSDLPDVASESDDDDDENNGVNSYLVRGEALAIAKKSNNKKPKSVSLSRDSDKHSDDDFISKLTSIVHGSAASDENDDEDGEMHKTSTETIDARDIVESVLQRRSKRSKKNTASINDAANENQEKSSNNNDTLDQAGQSQWTVTDDQLLDNSLNETTNSVLNAPTQSVETLTEPIERNAPEKRLMKKSKRNRPSTDERTVPIVIEPEMAWNDEMKKFYNDSWGGETFDVRKIRSRMPSKYNGRMHSLI